MSLFISKSSAGPPSFKVYYGYLIEAVIEVVYNCFAGAKTSRLPCILLLLNLSSLLDIPDWNTVDYIFSPASMELLTSVK